MGKDYRLESINHLNSCLSELAQQGKLISYQALASRLGINTAPIIAQVTSLLEQSVIEDVKAGRPVRASLIVQKGQAGIPRKGFFQLLQQLGVFHGDQLGEDAFAWHQNELAKIKQYYAIQ